METANRRFFQQLCAPGGILLLLAVFLLHSGWLTVSAPAIDFYYYTVFAAGLLMAWRFHSSRILFLLLTLLLAHRALEFFAEGTNPAFGAGRIAFEAIACLLPINFVLLSQARERGFGIPAITPHLALLFFESIFVAVLCRPGQMSSPWLFHVAFVKSTLFSWTPLPQPSLVIIAISFAILLGRFLIHPKPLESGILWSFGSAVLGLQMGGIGRLGSAYFATAGLMLLVSIVENSYLLAYHDELTLLPSRRAFNDGLLRLEPPYAVAVVDIDHFKKFNDTFGHETGDQVLRMVGARLAGVTGGGQAYRVGGEEFSVLFRDKGMKDALPHLESLRAAIEESIFHVRSLAERRSSARGADRRNQSRGGARSADLLRRATAASGDLELSVTVSIGVAEPNPGSEHPEQAGRNRIEAAAPSRTRGSRFKRSIA